MSISFTESSPLIHASNVHNSQGWVMLEPGARSTVMSLNWMMNHLLPPRALGSGKLEVRAEPHLRLTLCNGREHPDRHLHVLEKMGFEKLSFLEQQVAIQFCFFVFVLSMR